MPCHPQDAPASFACAGSRQPLFRSIVHDIENFFCWLLAAPLSQITEGAKVVDICKFGDTVIATACAGIYQKKVKGAVVEKGVAFPT